MDPDSAFYAPHGDDLVPDPLTRGPWRVDHQHGGPPAALLARAFEALAPADAWHVARVTVEFLRPIAVDRPLRVSAERSREGKQVLGLHGVLTCDGRPVARAHALCVRLLPLELPADVVAPEQPADPESFPAFRFPFFPWPVGYHTAVETRLESGAIGDGPAVAWLRPLHPLVRGEPTSPLQRVLIVADAINGVGFALDLRRYTFVNADLTVYLHRMPEGEWVRLAATPSPQPTGVGLVEAQIGDRRGPIGRALEAQVLALREPATP